jgi:hypothetical protein
MSEFFNDTENEFIQNNIYNSRSDGKEFNPIEEIFIKVEPTDVPIQVSILPLL